MKFAICNETYTGGPGGEGWTFERTCADVAACGYDGIEIALATLHPDPRELTIADARAFARTAQASGLEVVGLHWLLKGPPGLHVSAADDATRRRTADYLGHLADLCGAMGGTVMVLGSPQQRDVPAGVAYDDAFARAAATCRRVAERAWRQGVTLALEPLGPDYTNFLTTAAEAARLIAAVDHPGCRLHLDALAMTSEAEPAAAILRAHGAQLVHFHATDTSLGGPGTGTIDYAPIVAALADVGYAGYVSVEVFDFAPGGPAIARASLAFLRRAWGVAGGGTARP